MLSRVDNALPIIIKHVCQTRIDREPRSRRGPVKPVSIDTVSVICSDFFFIFVNLCRCKSSSHVQVSLLRMMMDQAVQV
jgi:hypothetical protein